MVMNKNHLNVFCEDDLWQGVLPEGLPAKVFSEALSYLKKNKLASEIGFDKPIEINLSLSNNAEVQKLNASFRGMDKPTNVLSFANIDGDDFFEEIKQAGIVELGDIIIALETLQQESNLKEISLQDHFAHLLIHGILHLFGYDHQTDEEANEMEGIEINILEKLKIANPYEVE